jgi:hypothetical protein
MNGAGRRQAVLRFMMRVRVLPCSPRVISTFVIRINPVFE